MTTILLMLALLSFFSAVGVVMYWRRTRRCPDDRVLRDTISGRRRNAEVMTHLGVCEKCRRKVDAWNGGIG